MEKFEKEIDDFKNVVLSMAFIAILIWMFNEGKTDFGIVHHVSVYMMLTCLACMLLLLGIIIVLVLCDVCFWLLNK